MGEKADTYNRLLQEGAAQKGAPIKICGECGYRLETSEGCDTCRAGLIASTSEALLERVWEQRERLNQMEAELEDRILVKGNTDVDGNTNTEAPPPESEVVKGYSVIEVNWDSAHPETMYDFLSGVIYGIAEGLEDTGQTVNPPIVSVRHYTRTDAPDEV